MTENELRDKVARTAEEWCAKGVWEWNDNLNTLIKVYNDHKPLTRNIAYKPELGGWCGLFVSDCFILNDLADLIVTEVGAYEFMSNAKKVNAWKPRGTYIPKRGDIIVYAYEQTNYTQYHVGIVTNADSNIIYTTEGNVQDRILMLAHKPDDKTILGFWAVDYASKVSTGSFDLTDWPDPPKKNGTYIPAVKVSNNQVAKTWQNI